MLHVAEPGMSLTDRSRFCQGPAMPQFDPPVLTTWSGWPDLLTGPYVVVFRWALTPEINRVECVGLEVRTYADESLPGVENWAGPREPEASRRAVTAQLWRSLRVRELIDTERRSLADKIGDASWKELWRREPPRGDYLRRGDHEKVAAVYRAALAAGEPPRRAVARAFQLSPSAAANRIARARAHGLIPATTRGRTHETRKP